MERRTKGCLLIGLGVGILLVIVTTVLVGGAGYWFYRELGITHAQRSPEDAWREMDAARARFGTQQPFIVLEGDRPGVREDVEPRLPGSPWRIESLHVITFDARDRQLVRVTMPFWLLRLAPGGKLFASSDALRGVKGTDHLTIKQLEELGPGLLVDHREADGSRVLMWTD